MSGEEYRPRPQKRAQLLESLLHLWHTCQLSLQSGPGESEKWESFKLKWSCHVSIPIPSHAEWEFYQLRPIEERLQASHLLPHLAGTALLTNYYTCVRLLVLALIPLSVKVNQHPFLKQDGSFTANIFKSCRCICVYVYEHIYSCSPTQWRSV